MDFITLLLLVLASVATLFLMPAVRSIQRLDSTDAAGSEITLLFLCAPRWLAVAAVLCVLIARGSFQWISASTGIQAAAVFGSHLVAGLVCGACLVVARERIPIVGAGLWVFAVAIPIATIVYAAASIGSASTPPPALRVLVSVIPVLDLVGIAMAMRVRTRFEEESSHPAKRTSRMTARRAKSSAETSLR